MLDKKLNTILMALFKFCKNLCIMAFAVVTSLAQRGGIDIWINNEGQNTPHMFSWETGETYTENIIKTNITGVIYGSQIATVGMLKQGHARFTAWRALAQTT